MFRLLAFLITGFWPSRSQLRALRKDLDDLQSAHNTLKKKFNTLAGSYYAEFEPEPEPRREVLITHPGVEGQSGGQLRIEPPDDFPEEEFQAVVASKRKLNGGL